MARLVCDYCDCLFNFKPPKGSIVDPSKGTYCSERCKKNDTVFIKLTNLWKWRKE